jgi:hypothetical protein
LGGFSCRSNPDDLKSSKSDRPPYVSSSKSGPYGGSDHANPQEIGVCGGGRACLFNEDMNISDRNDRDRGRVVSSRNLEVILRDDGEARIIEDAPNGDGVADAYEGGSCLDPRC